MEPHDPRPAAVSGKEEGEDDAQRSRGGAEDLERKRGCSCREEKEGYSRHGEQHMQRPMGKST